MKRSFAAGAGAVAGGRGHHLHRHGVRRAAIPADVDRFAPWPKDLYERVQAIK